MNVNKMLLILIIEESPIVHGKVVKRMNFDIR